MKHLRLLTLLAGALLLGAPAGATTYQGFLDGLQERPNPNASPATGFVTLTLTGTILTVDLNWTGLVGGPATAGHIHCCTTPANAIGVAVGFPNLAPATSGVFLQDFNLLDPTVYNAAFLTANGGTAAGASAALIAGLDAGLAYVNVHNDTFRGGEIRANLAAVPEPASVGLCAAGLAGLIAVARRRRKNAA